jgi:hypothetical protein
MCKMKNVITMSPTHLVEHTNEVNKPNLLVSNKLHNIHQSGNWEMSYYVFVMLQQHQQMMFAFHQLLWANH